VDVAARLLFECRHLRRHVTLQKDSWLPRAGGASVGGDIFGGYIDLLPKGLIRPDMVSES
jgi:hypothetical protein